MKTQKFILFACLLSIFDFANAQKYYPFPDSNAIWNEAEYFNYVPMRYYSYGLKGDTMINSKVYHKLYSIGKDDTSFIAINAMYMGAIREENKIVYVTMVEDSSKEYILYDFSKGVGEPLQIRDWASGGYILGIITSIDSVLINGLYRKRFFFDNPMFRTWIEGIGSTSGLLTPGQPFTTAAGSYLKLVCFKLNDTVYYLASGYNDCFPTLTSVENIDNGKKDAILNIHPNPTKDYFTIKLNSASTTSLSLSLYQIDGRIIYSSETKDVPPHHTETIDLTNYSKGIYFLKVRTDEGVFTRKVIYQ